MINEIKGQQFGVRFSKRGLDDPHVCLQLLLEDDGHWHEIDEGYFSNRWLDDLIEVLQAAKTVMEANCEKGPYSYGYRFKEEKK